MTQNFYFYRVDNNAAIKKNFKTLKQIKQIPMKILKHTTNFFAEQIC